MATLESLTTRANIFFATDSHPIGNMKPELPGGKLGRSQTEAKGAEWTSS